MIFLLSRVYFSFVLSDLLHMILLEKHNLEISVQMHDVLGNKATPVKQMIQDGPMKTASVLTPYLH